MDGAASILVIILSVFLGLFLLLAIILVVLLIKVTRQIKSVTTTAQKAAEGVERTISNVSIASSSAAIMKIIASAVKNTKKSKSKSK